MIRYARLAAAALPLLGLGALWVESDRTYNSGTDWEVPIEGYDPRDYLRGHYVEFSYDWPGVDLAQGWPAEGLCLEGRPPLIARAVPTKRGVACRHRLRAESAGIYGTQGLERGRLYIGQERAAQLQQQLRNRDQRGIVTIRLREDGSFTPIAIRFRALTPAEIAERDAPRDERFDPLGPPAVMQQQP